MGRIALIDPAAEDILKSICERATPCTGVIVGSLTPSSHLVAYIAETPDPEPVEPPPSYPDIDWLLEHAKQVVRMLPGGLTVLGFVLAAQENPLGKEMSSTTRQLANSLSRLEPSSPLEPLLLHCTGSIRDCRCVCESGLVDIECRVSATPLTWLQLDSGVVLDLPVALTDQTDQTLLTQVDTALQPFIENVQRAVCVFNNQLLPPRSHLVPQPEKELSKKKGRSRPELDYSDGENQKLSVDLLFRDDVYDSVEVVETSVRMRLVGKIACRAYVDTKSTVEAAEAAIKQDLVRSLTGRTAMHCDSLVGDEKEGTMSTNAPVIHEPPRRVFVSLPDSTLAISDYLYPGEGSEDCVESVKELFGFTPTDDGIEDDVEIVASPKEIDGSGQNESKQLKKTRRSFQCGSVEMVSSLAVAGLSAAFAYFAVFSEGE